MTNIEPITPPPAPVGPATVQPVALDDPRVVVTVIMPPTPVKRPINHAFHLIMTILTGGLWGIVWIIAAATR